jgi:hypothetical protein
MKKVLSLCLMLIFGLNSYSQNVDMENLNYNLLDSLVLARVNFIRDSLGRNTIHFSKYMRDNVSKVQTKKMIEAKRCFHPERNGIITNIENKVFTEVQKKNPKVKVDFDGNLDNMTMEVCIVTPKIDWHVTYQDLAKQIVDTWSTSEPHKMVLEYYGKSEYLVGSCSTKLGVYRGYPSIYSTLHVGIVFMGL